MPYLYFGYAGLHVPAYPKPVKYTQPDGTTVVYRIMGDEYNHWLESTGGYVLKKSDKGYLCYATKIHYRL